MQQFQLWGIDTESMNRSRPTSDTRRFKLIGRHHVTHEAFSHWSVGGWWPWMVINQLHKIGVTWQLKWGGVQKIYQSSAVLSCDAQLLIQLWLKRTIQKVEPVEPLAMGTKLEWTVIISWLTPTGYIKRFTWGIPWSPVHLSCHRYHSHCYLSNTWTFHPCGFLTEWLWSSM